MVDAFFAFTAAPRRANCSPQNTGLTIKLCTCRATFHVSRSVVGCGNNVVEGVLSVGWGLAKDVLLGSRERKCQADGPGCVKLRHDSFCRLGLEGEVIRLGPAFRLENRLLYLQLPCPSANMMAIYEYSSNTFEKEKTINSCQVRSQQGAEGQRNDVWRWHSLNLSNLQFQIGTSITRLCISRLGYEKCRSGQFPRIVPLAPLPPCLDTPWVV